MGYSWFRVDGGFALHPKTLALCDALNEPLADAYILRLWSWVHCYAPTGHIPSRVTGQIESAVRWRGAPGQLIKACTEVGWLEPVSDGFLVHDWHDYQAVFAQKAKKDAAKKRQRRRRAVTPAVTPPSRVTAPPTRRDETRRDETSSLVLVEVEATPTARSIFEHWRQATGKANAKLDQKRRDLIDRRLGEGHRPEDLMAAIDGYVKSPWHQGQNPDRKKYLGLELMLRDTAHIEAGLDLLMQHQAITTTQQPELRSL
ncbi:MAG: conserved phage C-terminal domain-containing protein [Archangiaceae bacterium]|nr:conserved phage C-terminal domain-containing protein [Archangiaceae bacterium]